MVGGWSVFAKPRSSRTRIFYQSLLTANSVNRFVTPDNSAAILLPPQFHGAALRGGCAVSTANQRLPLAQPAPVLATRITFSGRLHQRPVKTRASSRQV